MKHFSKLVFLAVIVSTLFSCEKEEEDQEDSTIMTKEVTLSRSTLYGEDWVYFSLSAGTEVSGIDDSNYQTNTTWDIAFNRYNVRTNGGTSGVGQAGAVDVGEIDFDEATLAPSDGYTEDATIQIVESLNIPNPPIMMASNGNVIFMGVIDLDSSNPPPVYTANNHIYYLKTADGKYAKIWIKGFYNDQGDSGYLNFKYSYQEDGTRSFE